MKCMEFRVEGSRPVGSSTMTWFESVEPDSTEIEIDKKMSIKKRNGGRIL